MNESRVELKVGLFVLIGLVFLAVLVMMFSKGTTFSGKHIELKLMSANVGGIKRGANIFMSGVAVGRVSQVELGDAGTNVTIYLRVAASRKIFSDAEFEIEQAGFLGDQYVAISPGLSKGTLLKDGDTVICRDPFNLQETIAKAADTVNRIGQVTTNVNAAVNDVRRFVLTEEKLSQLGASIENFARLVTDAKIAVSNMNLMVAGNALPVTLAISNLGVFTEQLPAIGSRVSALVATNEPGITMAMRNLETGSVMLTNVLAELQDGRGVAGRLLRDEKLADELSLIAQNLNATTANLAVTTSNLNTRGLWGILWKQKPSRPKEKNETAPPKS